MIIVGGTDVDDVDVGVVDEVFGFGNEFGDALFCTPIFEHFGVDIATGNEFGMF